MGAEVRGQWAQGETGWPWADGRCPGALCARAEHRGEAGVSSPFQEPLKPVPGPSEGGGLYDTS